MIKNTNKLQLYSVHDVSEFLQLSPRTIYDHIKKGLLKGILIGNKYRFTEDHIKDYIQTLQEKINPTDMKQLVEEDREPRRY
jgi:excisionase family DNA binding protein